MVIKDLRKEKFLQIDVKLILEKIIDNSPSDLYNGLDRILILDTDYRKRALGLHRQKEDGSYEIELMMKILDDIPPELINDKEVITFQIGELLFHELYHHKNSIYKKRQIKKNKDEELADDFSMKMLKEVLLKIFTKEELKSLREKLLKLRKKYN